MRCVWYRKDRINLDASCCETKFEEALRLVAAERGLEVGCKALFGGLVECFNSTLDSKAERHNACDDRDDAFALAQRREWGKIRRWGARRRQWHWR